MHAIIKKILRKVSRLFPKLEPYIFKLIRDRYVSKGESIIEDILRNKKIKFKREYVVTFPFKVKRTNYVYIDFYLPRYNLFIEYNGVQHYKYTPKFHRSIYDFDMQVRRDDIVRRYCKDNNITLLEIPYTMNEEQIYEYLCKYLGK